MNALMQAVNQFAAQHAVVYGLLCAGAALVLPKVLAFAETTGVDDGVELLKEGLRKAGVPEDKIKEAEGHLAKAAARAAEDFQKDAQA